MHRINTKVSGWIALFSITAMLSLMTQSGFADDDDEDDISSGETKSVTLTAKVGSPPPGISLKDALKNFPETVAFEYDYNDKKFKTNDKPFVVNNTLALEYNVTIQSNKPLVNNDGGNDKIELNALLKVGDSVPTGQQSKVIKWCGAGETPATISFEIQRSETVPAPGDYSGEMTLVFEPAPY